MTFAKTRCGVIGGFTPVEVIIDFAENEEIATTGTHNVGIKVPAGRFVYGVFVRNQADDLDGTSTITLKVGDTIELNALDVDDIKGSGKAKLVEEPLYVAADADVKLVLSEDMEAGKLSLGVIYG